MSRGSLDVEDLELASPAGQPQLDHVAGLLADQRHAEGRSRCHDLDRAIGEGLAAAVRCDEVGQPAAILVDNDQRSECDRLVVGEGAQRQRPHRGDGDLEVGDAGGVAAGEIGLLEAAGVLVVLGAGLLMGRALDRGLVGVPGGVELRREPGDELGLERAFSVERRHEGSVPLLVRSARSTSAKRRGDLPGHAHAVEGGRHDPAGVSGALAGRLRAGIKAFGKTLRGYLTEEAVLIATESRTSSPVRVTRDAASLESISMPGLYPTGEGAGYAGGIVSAALDGVRVARQIAATLGRGRPG